MVLIIISCACMHYLNKLHEARLLWHFVLPVLEYFSAVWCSAADTHLKLLDRIVSGACYTAGSVLNCDLSHRRSVAVLCMLYKIRCNPKHPLCVTLPVPYVPVRVTRGALIAHRYTAGLLFPSQSLSGMIWLTPYLMVWDWRVSRAGPMPLCWPSCSLLFCLQLFSLYLLFLYRLVVWGRGLRTDRVPISLSRPCIANLFIIIIIIIRWCLLFECSTDPVSSCPPYWLVPLTKSSV